MLRNFSLGLLGVALALCTDACGDKDPDPCPDVPPCISGSTWNATTCACLLDDEYRDAAIDSYADRATVGDGGFDDNEAAASDARPGTSDAGDETGD